MSPPATTTALSLVSLQEAGRDPDAEALAVRLVTEVVPILDENCFACHGKRRGKGGVRFHELDTVDEAVAELENLLLAHDMLASHEMPPEDEPQPTQAQRDTVMQWISDLIAHADAKQGIDPGWFSTRRLNNDEYRLTMRDLLGVDPSRVDLAAGLPADDLGYGFNTIGDALTVSPLHFEAYLATAEQAVDIGLGPVVDVSTKLRKLGPIEGFKSSRALPSGGQFLLSTGAVRVIAQLSADSVYEIAVTAWGTRGGPDLPRLSVRIDDRELKAWDVEAEDKSKPQKFTVTTTLDAGPHEITAHFTNDYYVKGEADRNLAVETIEIAGPLDAEGARRGGAWNEVFFVEAGPDADSQRDAARAILSRFAQRAFRRPLREGESDRLLALYETARNDGEAFESAVRQGLQAVLVSPSFLYLSVSNTHADDPSVRYALSGHELASRLSYFLWGSVPDGELIRLADLDLLIEPRVLRGQVRRMLADSRSEAFIDGFAGQWLLLRNLSELDIDRERFTSYDEQLASDMTAEALAFFADMIRANRPIMDLVNARDTFLNERLATHYSIDGIRGDRLRRVILDEESPRGGVLTMGAVLTVTSNPTRTSPVKRGLFVLDQLLGSPPPPPPSDVPPLEQAKVELGDNPTIREQLAAHLLDSTCASCHVRMDPIGLSMEQFDAVGRWREPSGGETLDVSAELPGGITFEGPSELKQVLLKSDQQIIENLTRRMMIYALGRGLEGFDRPSVSAIMAETAGKGNGLADLIEAIAASEAFTTCRGREERQP